MLFVTRLHSQHYGLLGVDYISLSVENSNIKKDLPYKACHFILDLSKFILGPFSFSRRLNTIAKLLHIFYIVKRLPMLYTTFKQVETLCLQQKAGRTQTQWVLLFPDSSRLLSIKGHEHCENHA